MTVKTLNQTNPKSGFTLIEMLIAVGLLVLMMSIFAQIFALATESLVRQRGIGQNDQKARGLFIILDGDLKKISYAPLTGEDGITPLLGDASDVEYPPPAAMSTDPDWQRSFLYDGQIVDAAHRGYVYISENDPDDDGDDRLAITVNVRRQHPRNRDETPYYGKASQFGTSTARDQPAYDDGNFDDASQSELAEISYFLRDGKLYRRVILVRQALLPNAGDANVDEEAQPNGNGGGDFMSGYGGNFYRDFDFSAHFEPTLGHAQFHGTLSNDPGATDYPLGIPSNRFGFHHADGRPMEYFDGSNGREFIGSHLHSETSDSAFRYPQVNQSREFLTGNGSTTLNSRKTIPAFSNDGIRTGEDILMSNVVSFDIRVWDEALQSYVNLGWDDSGNSDRSDFGVNRRYRFTTEAGTEIETAGYGDRAQGANNFDPGANNIFDTWHPNAVVERFDGDTARNITQTMYRPLKFAATNDASTWNKNTQALVWQDNANVEVSTGDVVIPSPSYYTGTSRSSRIPAEFQGVIAFRAIVVGETQTVMTGGDPDWEAATSLTEFKSNGYESDRFTDPDNSAVIWEPFFNLQPLKSMVMTIRFRDQGSDQIRQVTVVHTFAR